MYKKNKMCIVNVYVIYLQVRMMFNLMKKIKYLFIFGNLLIMYKQENLIKEKKMF